MIGRTLSRYLLWEMARALAVSLAWLMMIGLLVIFMRSRFTDAGRLLSAGQSLAGLIVVLPYLFGYLLPVAVLTAAVSTFGRLSSDNELLAMRSAGLSPAAISTAPLAVGLAASLALLWLNVEGFRYAAAAMTRMENHLNFSAERLTHPGTSFEAEDEEGKLAFSFPRPLEEGSRPIQVSRMGGGGSFQLSALDFKCRLEVRRNRSGKRRRFVSFRLHDVQVIQDPAAPYSELCFEEWHISDLELPGTISRALIGGRSEMRASLPQNLEDIRRRNARMDAYAAAGLNLRRRAGARLVASGAGGGGSGVGLAFSSESWGQMLRAAGQLEKIADIRREISRKLAFSFSPLLFALVGIGLGALTRRSSKLIGLSLGVLAAAFYYGSWVLAKALVEQGLMPPSLAPWLPNALALAGGLGLLRHRNRR